MRTIYALIVIAAVAGCGLEEKVDLQPQVAVFGYYGVLSGSKAPQPAPQKGVCGTCGAKVPPGGGTLGDGRVKVPCPECNKQAACPCGGKGYVVKDGKNWACGCNQCKDGKCPTLPSAR